MSAVLDIDHLLRELTLQEKASLTSGSSFWYTAAVERLGIPKIMVSDGPHGLRAQPGEGDHVGIGGSLPATCFPTASAVASSWNPQLLHRIGQALGQEARSANLSVILGPGINMKRSPLCGRNFEYFSEDPLLAGELAVGIVDGIQSRGVGTSVKHYAANNQETDRLRVDAVVDERTLREIYLPAFERVITASQPWTVMCSYNKVNGTSVSEHPWLLTTVLREEFGFEGLVVSDWGAVYHRVPALLAGLDLEMPPALQRSPQEVYEAVLSGQVPLQVLDARVRSVLELVSKGAGVLELQEDFDAAAHHALARQAAGESIVLLHNDGLLPLAPRASIAVVGELARTPRFQGAGSSQVNPTRVDVLLDELLHHFGPVPFAAGYELDDPDLDGPELDEPEPVAQSEVAGVGHENSWSERGKRGSELIAEAVTAAGAAETVVVVLGLPSSYESEGFDRNHMDLPAQQLDLLRAVAAVNPNVVVVLVNGSTVVLGDVLPHARALVEAWLGGQAAAGAIADVLTGAINPSGRLAETIPHRLQDDASYLNFPGDPGVVRYGEGVFIGYRGYDRSAREVAFPFGFGLSYTTFAMSDLEVSLTGAVADGTLAAAVSVVVTNTGQVPGAEVVQVYVGDPLASLARPPRELKGFTKVHLDPGASTRVEIELDQRAFSYWSAQHSRWVVEAGQFTVEVGHHSRNLPLVTVLEVQAPSLAGPLHRDSTLTEWMEDPRGRALLLAEVAAGRAPALGDQELVKVVGSMPMSTLASFGGLSLDHDRLDRVVSAWEAGRSPASS